MKGGFVSLGWNSANEEKIKDLTKLLWCTLDGAEEAGAVFTGNPSVRECCLQGILKKKFFALLLYV
jgi:hypothetical protein